MRGRRVIERRARVFLGCEGESEQGYGAFLQRLVDACGAKIHVVPINLQPAGDPLALAKKAERKLAEEIRRGGPFLAQAVMLDTDRLAELPDGGCDLGPVRDDRDLAVPGLRRAPASPFRRPRT